MSATVQEFTIDLATIGSVNTTVPFPGFSRGMKFTDLYVAELPVGAPVILIIGVSNGAGFRNVSQGDSFDCMDRATCEGTDDGVGVQVTALTVGTMRIACSMGSGGAAKR